MFKEYNLENPYFRQYCILILNYVYRLHLQDLIILVPISLKWTDKITLFRVKQHRERKLFFTFTISGGENTASVTLKGNNDRKKVK